MLASINSDCINISVNATRYLESAFVLSYSSPSLFPTNKNPSEGNIDDLLQQCIHKKSSFWVLG